MGTTTTLKFEPHGLYILVSTAKSDYPAAITDNTAKIEESLARGDQFEWGLYWCVKPGIGESRRYRERKGIWALQTTLYPDSSRKKLVAIEDDARIIVAIPVAFMDKAMIDRLNDDLKPKNFPHSQHARALAARSHSQQRSTKLTGAAIEPDDGRSRKWLGQAMYMMDRQGYVALKQGVRGISMMEREATALARKNLAAGIRSVEMSAHVCLRGPEAVFVLRALVVEEEEEVEEEKKAVPVSAGKENDQDVMK